MTQEQQNKILKIGKITDIVGAVIIALTLLWVLVGAYLAVVPPVGINIDYVQLGLGIIAGGVVGFSALMALLLFVKVKYPFYSDKKLKYIKEQRKQKYLHPHIPRWLPGGEFFL